MKNQNKRIKHCFTNCRDVADLWASQKQDRAHCRNARFESNKIYSYGSHYLLGVIIEIDGNKIALVNDTYYSKTTSGHTSDAYFAALNAGLITLKTHGNFSLNAIRESMQVEFDSLIDKLSGLHSQGADNFGLKYFNQDLKQFNTYCKKLGFNDLIIKIPESFLSECQKIGKIYSQYWEDRYNRHQLFLDESVIELRYRKIRGLSKRVA